MLTYEECDDLIFASYNRAAPHLKGDDSQTRDLNITRWLFREARLPFSFAPTVTVTGSKGKGSTAILCAAILQGTGHKVGLLTSPNFISHRERIRVDGLSIPEEDFVRIVNHLAPIIRQVDANLTETQYLSPTGLFLAIAVQHFLEQGVTACVLEVGRGGRFDEVSLIENHVSCFTPIMEEHLDKLGPDIASVAKHKSGIIKDGNIVISAQQQDIVQLILEKEAAAHHSTMYRVKDDITHVSGYQWDFQDVHICLKYLEQERAFRLNTPANYQAANLALAFASAVALEPDAKQVDAFITQRARLPGRCAIIRKHPKIIIDGAINRESAFAFLQSVLPLIQYPSALITALPADKEYQGVLNELMSHIDLTIITQAYSGYLKYTDEVFAYASTISDTVINEPDVLTAFNRGLDYVGKDGMLWVVGTQSLVREAIRFWNINMDWLVVPSYED